MKLEVRKKQLKPNGDIIIDNFYFYRSKLSRLIPNIVNEFDEIFKRCTDRSNVEEYC